MKSDTERKHFYSEKLHKRKDRLNVHLSKDLRSKLKTKKRALLVHKNDRVKILRGPETGKEVKVVRVNINARKVYLEGVVVKNSKGKEVLIPIEPSNLLLVGLESTPERKEIFREDAFIVAKKEVKKEDDKKDEKKTVVSEPKTSEKTQPVSQKSAHQDTTAQEARAHAAQDKQHKNY
ncbi:50S ribosomal protein L24 [Candidatus Micrarchaeota archaeon]|nr:50S ribosomal protein L24 [Candidatus Micrarchaeota archaeon]